MKYVKLLSICGILRLNMGHLYETNLYCIFFNLIYLLFQIPLQGKSPGR